MADEVGRDLPSFLTSVLDKTEYIWRNDVGEGTAGAHAEVIDQSIRMLRSIRDSLSWYSVIFILEQVRWGAGSTCSRFCGRVIIFLNHHIAITPISQLRLFFRQTRDNMSFYNLPSVMQSPFLGYLQRKFAYFFIDSFLLLSKHQDHVSSWIEFEAAIVFTHRARGQ